MRRITAILVGVALAGRLVVDDARLYVARNESAPGNARLP
jgi:hypothetical protein